MSVIAQTDSKMQQAEVQTQRVKLNDSRAILAQHHWLPS